MDNGPRKAPPSGGPRQPSSVALSFLSLAAQRFSAVPSLAAPAADSPPSLPFQRLPGLRDTQADPSTPSAAPDGASSAPSAGPSLAAPAADSPPPLPFQRLPGLRDTQAALSTPSAAPYGASSAPQPSAGRLLLQSRGRHTTSEDDGAWPPLSGSRMIRRPVPSPVADTDRSGASAGTHSTAIAAASGAWSSGVNEGEEPPRKQWMTARQHWISPWVLRPRTKDRSHDMRRGLPFARCCVCANGLASYYFKCCKTATCDSRDCHSVCTCAPNVVLELPSVKITGRGLRLYADFKLPEYPFVLVGASRYKDVIKYMYAPIKEAADDDADFLHLKVYSFSAGGQGKSTTLRCISDDTVDRQTFYFPGKKFAPLGESSELACSSNGCRLEEY